MIQENKKPKAPQVMYKWPYLFAPFPHYAIITEWIPFTTNDEKFIKWMGIYEYNENHPKRKQESRKAKEELNKFKQFLNFVVKIDWKKLHEPFI